MYKQILIARKDLDMSPGKLSAQISHASMSFITNMIRNHVINNSPTTPKHAYTVKSFEIEKDLYEQWIDGEFTKCVLKAKNKNHLLKAKSMAESLGLQEGKDFWLIRDNCHTELTPEENGRTLTAIGFRPMDSNFIDQIGKKYQLYS